MDGDVADTERLANFVLESNKLTRDGVHFKAFLPGGDGQRSLFRIDGLSDEYVAATGQAFVGNLRDKLVLGWGTIRAASIRKVIPLLLRADKPPPRHAVIEGWPDEIERRRALAMQLASKSDAHKCPKAGS